MLCSALLFSTLERGFTTYCHKNAQNTKQHNWHTSIHLPLIFDSKFQDFERFHNVHVGHKKSRHNDEEHRESTRIKNCYLPKAAWNWKYLLVIGGLLLQPILGLSSQWRRRALLRLLPQGPEPNSPERHLSCPSCQEVRY